MHEKETGEVSPLIENENHSGLFSRVGESRNIRGLLLPKNELSRPNKSGNQPVQFGDGSLKVPRDPSVITLNTEHDRFNPIGRATEVTETAEGWVAEFTIAETDEGDAYLANPVRKLSAEVAQLTRDAADRTRATFARLTGAAVVAEGAFESAALFSLADEEVETETPSDLRLEVDTLPETITATTPAGDEATYTPDADPAEENPDTEQEFSNMSDATNAGIVPATLINSTPAAKPVELGAIFSAINAVKRQEVDAADSETLLAALSDIKVNTTGGLTTAASGVLQPSWVGQLWQGKTYEQRFISLGSREFGGIQLGGRKGFTLNQGTALVQHWSGNKSELPTGTATTAVRSASRRSYGYGADIAREWYDLDGGADVIEAFMRGVVDSYAKITDEDALADIMTAALPNLTAAGTYPSQYPAPLGMLIDAVEAVLDADEDPTFVLVNPVAWRALIQTPKDLIPEFVSFDFKTGGTGSADGKVQVRKAPASAFTGLNATAPAVVAGSARAIEFREQGSTPIKLDALDIARGGIDRAVIGYMETFVVRPESFVAIGTASE